MTLLDQAARHPRAAALVGALCIAFSGILFRFSGATPATATVFRCLYALPWLAALAWLERRRVGAPQRREVRLAVLAGIFFTGDLLAWHHAVLAVGAGLATVLANLQVVVVAGAAWLLLGERPPRPVLIALPLMLGGVVLISGVVGAGAYGADPPLGVVLGLVAAACYAGYLLLARHGIGADGRPATGLLLATASTALVAALVGTLLGEFSPLPTWPAHGWLVLLAFTSQVAGYLLISSSLPRLPAVLTSLILMAQPITTVTAGFVLLGEDPSAAQLVGVLLVVSGLLVATLRRGQGQPAARTRAASAGTRLT